MSGASSADGASASEPGGDEVRGRGHVVVVGVGTIGYRVLTLLDDLGIDTTAIEQSAESRSIGATAVHGPVLVGNARLPEELHRTGVASAACLVAVTDDDRSRPMWTAAGSTPSNRGPAGRRWR